MREGNRDIICCFHKRRSSSSSSSARGRLQRCISWWWFLLFLHLSMVEMKRWPKITYVELFFCHSSRFWRFHLLVVVKYHNSLAVQLERWLRMTAMINLLKRPSLDWQQLVMRFWDEVGLMSIVGWRDLVRYVYPTTNLLRLCLFYFWMLPRG